MSNKDIILESKKLFTDLIIYNYQIDSIDSIEQNILLGYIQDLLDELQNNGMDSDLKN